MKEDISVLIVNKLMLLSTIIITAYAIIKVITDVVKTKADKDIQIAREQSAGATAIAQIKSEMEIMKKLIDEGKFSQEQIKHLVDKLEDNYSKLLEKFLEFFKK